VRVSLFDLQPARDPSHKGAGLGLCLFCSCADILKEGYFAFESAEFAAGYVDTISLDRPRPGFYPRNLPSKEAKFDCRSRIAHPGIRLAGKRAVYGHAPAPRWRALRWRRSTGTRQPRETGLASGLPRVVERLSTANFLRASSATGASKVFFVPS
jgi:hypothetical protein